MTRGPILCCGCGKEAVGGVKPCDCATGCGFRRGEPGSVWLISRGQARRNELAELIKARLVGVDPESQDLVLEDHDWREIVAALEDPRP